MAVQRWLINPVTDNERYLGFAIASLLVLVAIVALNAVASIDSFWSVLATVIPIAFLSNRYLSPIVERERRKRRK